ncbi:FtsW/RodA/SpoVE family cell cycle protein [Candidatus Dojkabacteria bacterium]|nr:FtsW/RodA/SpoVE family cell cycle protein [Candidatus Dojkabacteria bacterium]
MNKNSLQILIPTIIISIFGIVTLLSSQAVFTLSGIVAKQILFVFLGIIIFFLAKRFDLTILKYRPIIIIIYVLTIVLLVLTLLIGQSVNGARRWISFLGVQLQPSEIAKITIILVTAYIFTLKDKYKEWILLVVSFLFLLPIVLLIYFEPHGSMSLICVILWFLIAFFNLNDQVRNILILLVSGLIFTGIFFFTALSQPIFLLITLLGIVVGVFVFFARDNWKLPIAVFVSISLLLGTTGSFVWNVALSDYQKGRITSFVNPDENSSTSAFNVLQSKIAIGSGGIWGKGFGSGTQSRLNFLPFHQTDFIFASFAESFGLIGSVLLLALFGYIFYTIFITAVKYPKDDFLMPILVVLGLKVLLELSINLGTNLGLTPATGIPLPLMSAGGTITILTFFSLGLIQGIIATANQRNIYSHDDIN